MQKVETAWEGFPHPSLLPSLSLLSPLLPPVPSSSSSLLLSHVVSEGVWWEGCVCVVLTHGTEHSLKTHFFSLAGHMAAGDLRTNENRLNPFLCVPFLFRTSE